MWKYSSALSFDGIDANVLKLARELDIRLYSTTALFGQVSRRLQACLLSMIEKYL